ncbi:hypothetical protein MOQ72_19105 [Saccharopolyspora sp. K220]|uniref:hypothetical protein n=1 Tax=Saccharopolyspora soli TaxID=2926618 RepID=UPI001F584FB0|nr:hypothetical protein [Saccharopolyspora soli]MCI2419557.1 hypothetical protein [Saccharopolyspora soli]
MSENVQPVLRSEHNTDELVAFRDEQPRGMVSCQVIAGARDLAGDDRQGGLRVRNAALGPLVLSPMQGCSPNYRAPGPVRCEYGRDAAADCHLALPARQVGDFERQRREPLAATHH